MAGDLWWIVVIALAGAAVVGVGTFASSPAAKRPGHRRHTPTHREAPPSVPTTASLARGVAYMYGRVGRESPSRSVNRNFRRASERIDAIDPYEGQRRVAEAMSRAGILPPHLHQPEPVDDEDTQSRSRADDPWRSDGD